MSNIKYPSSRAARRGSHAASLFFRQCRASASQPQVPTHCLRNSAASRPSSFRIHTRPSTLFRNSSEISSFSATKLPLYRPFATTSPHRATEILQNPRNDENGTPMTIEISPNAAKRLQQIVSTPSTRSPLSTSPQKPSPSHLRITVTSGGCHGFQYLMSLEPSSKISPEEDTVFASSSETDAAKVVLDESSLEILKGAEVDYETKLIGSQFKVLNPRAKSECGCGTSFDIE
ncbi:MAG: hypothetical protein Q9227_008767 [Pyrenula ochraceoflavens]